MRSYKIHTRETIVLLVKRSIKKILLCSILVRAITVMDAQFVDYNLHVTSEIMQEFYGIGFSIHNAKASFLPSDSSIRQKLYSETFSGFNTISFWSYIEEPELRDTVISEAIKHGLKRIIVNPTGEPSTPIEHASQLFLDIKEYMDAGYPIYGTTIMNKPNTNESGTLRQTPQFLADCSKLLKYKLDSAGYDDILISGPSTAEWEPYIDPTLHGAVHGYGFEQGDNMLYLNGLLNDQEAIGALSAFDIQSYGWSVDSIIQELAQTHGKELWISLAAIDGENRKNGDPILGPITAANCLANINHGVKIWNFWVWDQLSSFKTGEMNKRGKFLQQIGMNFKEGAIIRKVLSDPYNSTAQMFWNYYDYDNPSQNTQPVLVAAAAKNVDNSFVIGLVNLTGVHAQHFYSRYFPAEANIMNICVNIDEFKQNEIGLFDVTRVMPDGSVSSTGKIVLMKNSLKLACGSQDMLIIKAPEIFESDQVLLTQYRPKIVHVGQNENEHVVLEWTDNSPNESGFIIERKIEDNSEYVILDTVNANIINYTDPAELSNGATYHYRVTAINSVQIEDLIIPDSISSGVESITVGFTGNSLLISAADINVFPNPSNGTIYLKSNVFFETCQLNIYYSTGNLIRSRIVNMNEPIDISDLPNGIYIIQVGDGRDYLRRKVVLYR